MPKFLGMEPKTYLWVGGGLAAVLVLYYVIRSRGSAQQQAGGQISGGLGPTGAAPAPAQAAPESSGDMYAQQLMNLQVAAAQEQLNERQAMFQLQQQYQSSILPAAAGAATAQYGAEQNYYSQISQRQVSCPGDASVRIDPNTGQAYCRQKTSGSILGIPVGDMLRTVQGFISGVEAAAPQGGYQVGQAAFQGAAAGVGQAASYYTGQAFGAPQVGGTQQTNYYTPAPTVPYTVPIMPGSGVSPIPYQVPKGP